MTGILCALAGGVFAEPFTPRTPVTLTANGNAQVDTAQSKFGGASALFDGSGDYIQIGSGQYFPAGDDFTIECFFRIATGAQFQGIMALGNARGASSQEFALYVENVAGSYYMRVAYNFGAVLALTSGADISVGTWHHVAVSRAGDVYRLFVDGVLKETETDSGLNIGVSGGVGKIGSFSDGTLVLNGHVDEIRISNIARYTSGFTPTTSAFTDDQNTLLLVHCDGSDGSTTFTDDVT